MSAEPTLGGRPFVSFWLTRTLSTLSFQMLSVALGWQVYALTNSALALGLVGLAQFVPMVLLTLAVGHVADRYDRRRIAGICQAIEAAVALTLALGSAGGWIGRDGIYALAALLGAARAFEGPTIQALLPGLVPPVLVPRATALSASANQTAQIAGPALGGLLYAAGSAVVYGSAAVSLILAAAVVTSIPMAPVVRGKLPLTPATLLSGIAYIRAHPVILGVTTLDLFAVLFGGATALMPIFARDILGSGALGLGLLRASPAVGALAVSVVLARRPLRRPVGRTIFIAIGIFGVATIAFGLSRLFAVSVAALIVLGAADTLNVVIRQSLVQLRTPDALRGRVTAVNGLFIGTSNQLGEFESGVTAALIGAVPAVVVGGVATIIVGLVWMRLFPGLAGLHGVHEAMKEPEAALPNDVAGGARHGRRASHQRE